MPINLRLGWWLVSRLTGNRSADDSAGSMHMSPDGSAEDLRLAAEAEFPAGTYFLAQPEISGFGTYLGSARNYLSSAGNSPGSFLFGLWLTA